jgi:iron complex outermembrane receptor protein
MSCKSNSLVFVAVAIAATLSNLGEAQTVAPQTPPASPTTEPGTSLEEVTVTAQRRNENLQRTPVAVTALSQAVLDELNVRTTQDLMQMTPSLEVSTEVHGPGGGSATFFLRGVGQERAGNGSQPAVGVYVDDFYYPSLNGAIFNILDLDQVEVLRGPQGTLFGRDTIGGAIRYTTKKPDFTDSAYLQGTVGSFERRDGIGSANWAFSDKVAVRVTLGSLRTDGYVRKETGGPDAGATDNQLARLQLRVAPTAGLDIILSTEYSRSILDGLTYTEPGPFAPIPNTVPFLWNHVPKFPGAQNPALFAYDNRYISQCVYCQPGSDGREFSNTKFTDTDAIVSWSLANGETLKSLTGYQEVRNSAFFDLDGTPLPISDVPTTGATRLFSQELQLDSLLFNERLNLVTGLYYSDQVDYNPAPPPQTLLGQLIPQTLFRTDAINKAAFVDGTFRLNSLVSVLGGVRYSVDDTTVMSHSARGALISDESARFPSTTGRAGIQLQWTDDIMNYASVSKGFRAGGFTPISNIGVVITPFKPETATSYEIGARTDWLDKTIRLNPTVFYVDWKDIQVQQVSPAPTGVLIFLENAAKAHSYGFELEGEAVATEHLEFFGNIALLRIKYDEIGATTAITVNSTFQRAPKTTYAIGARYRTSFSNGADLHTTVNWSWQDQQWSTPSDIDKLSLPSYGLLGARVEFIDPSKHWNAAVFGTNLTNKVYYVGGANYAAAGTGSIQYDLGRPREFGVSIRYSF